LLTEYLPSHTEGTKVLYFSLLTKYYSTLFALLTEAMARESTENLPLLRYCRVIQSDIEALQQTYGLGA
jgi:hypothetical protein